MKKGEVKLDRRVAGFALLEVLVTLLILSVGLLGLAGLQAHSLRTNMSAYQRTQASVLAMDIVDRMRANRDAALKGEYDLKFSDSSGVSQDALAKSDQTEWLQQLSDPSLLAGGDGAIDCTTSSPVCIVTVQWNDNRGSAAANASYQSFILSVEL